MVRQRLLMMGHDDSSIEIDVDVDETFVRYYIYPSDLLVPLGPFVPSYGVSPTLHLLANWHVFGPRRCRTQQLSKLQQASRRC
jgi:hypothetical protein